MKTINKKHKKFIHDAFFRTKNPSVLRLACIQLHLEGEDFNPDNYEKTMLKIFDKADKIIRYLRKHENMRKDYYGED